MYNDSVAVGSPAEARVSEVNHPNLRSMDRLQNHAREVYFFIIFFH